MKTLITLTAAMALARIEAETLTGAMGVTNRIDLAPGEAALIQYAKAELTWQSSDGDSVSLESARASTLANPAILAGPGSINLGATCILTYQKVKLPNATTLIITNSPTRLKVGDNQRLTLRGYPNRYGKERPWIAFSIVPSGGELSEEEMRGVTATITQTPIVLDGPIELIMWTSSSNAAVTYTLQNRTVDAPSGVLNANGERAIQIQTSDDGVNWSVSSVILPGVDDKKFIRLK